jgi:GH25 family lysozyme M1 (1,4-beta-N-acetylmuramidase)
MDIQAGAALARDKQLAFYHFANDGNAGDAVTEATWFISKVKPYIGKAVLFLDYEMDVPGSDIEWIKTFCSTIKAKTGISCHIYTSGSWAKNSIPNLWNELDVWLWQANYWYGYQEFWGYNPNTSSYMVTPEQGMKIHQYTSTGRLSGFSGNLDFNSFHGTMDEWTYYKTH